MLPNFQEYKYYDQNNGCTEKKEDLENGRNSRNEPSSTETHLEDSMREGQKLQNHKRKSTQRNLLGIQLICYNINNSFG